MLICHGLCWSRSAESSTPFPRSRYSRRNTACRTCPLRLPAGAHPVLETNCKISYGIKPGTPQALDTPMQDANPGNAGQSQAPGTAPHAPSEEWSILFHHHMREPFALCAQSSCSPGQSCQDFLWPHQVLTTISSHPLSVHRKIDPSNFFPDHSYFTHHFISFPDLQSTANNSYPSYPAAEQSSKGLTSLLESQNHNFGKDPQDHRVQLLTQHCQTHH